MDYQKNKYYKPGATTLCQDKRGAKCNNNDKGKCIALADTTFGKPCPFYFPTEDTVPADMVEYHALSQIKGGY